MGHTIDATRYDGLSIMTAPFTADPTTLSPRRLRGESGGWLDTRPALVACGFAAVDTPEHVRVVRLSDGQSWLFPKDAGTWSWSYPVAMSCDDLFIRVWSGGPISDGGAWRVARVRLDSLGPGIAPD